MSRPLRLALLLGLAAAALLAGGRDGATRVALALRWPALAARLAPDPVSRGVALYRAGDYPAADAAFAAAGRSATYDRGLSLAMTGRPALARAYFDAVLFANPADSAARDNRAVVDALVPVVQGRANRSGRIAALTTPPATPPLETFASVSRPLDGAQLVADDAWLATLPDDPGSFLRLRLAEEFRRRLALGQTPPEAGAPW